MFVTHDQEEALLLGDRVAVMQEGRFSQVGPPAEIYNRPATLAVAGFIGDFNILEPDKVERLFGSKPESAWAVHPQVIGISDVALTGNYSVHARIIAAHILGAIVRYMVDVKGVTLKLDTLNRPNAAMRCPGEMIWITVSPGDVCVLKH